MSGRLVLVRHGQSFANVDKRLDTRPPGAELTPLGRDQARAFARAATSAPGLLLHSVASRAAQTAAEIGAELHVSAREMIGVHEVQVGELENRNDQDAVDEFDATYRRWLKGERDVPMPGGESAAQVFDRYLPVVDELRTRYLDDEYWTSDIVVVSHGAAIRLVGAVLADIDSSFALEHHLTNTESVILTPAPDGSWNCERWGMRMPPFDPDAPAESSPDPMG